MISYTELTDLELATQLRAGDEAAFRFIYQKYWDKLLVVAAKRLNDVDEAEETVQDIFLNLWKRKDSFQLKKGFENYFAVAVKFEIINRLAKRARESQRNKAFAQIMPDYQAQSFGRFDLEVLQTQLEHTINSLPPKCQLIFRMSRDDRYTNKKIARELEISEKAVEKHITHALKTLKVRFGAFFSVVIILFLA